MSLPRPIVLVVFTAMAAAFAGCGACGGRRTSLQDEPAPPEALLHGAKLHYFQGDERVAVARAAQLVYQRSNGEFQADEVYVKFDSRDGGTQTLRGGVEVRAASAKGSLPAKRLEAEGDVRLRSGSGTTGRTERATYDGVAGTVSGDAPVWLRGPGYALSADGGFHYQAATGQVEFVGPVMTRVGGQ